MTYSIVIRNLLPVMFEPTLRLVGGGETDPSSLALGVRFMLLKPDYVWCSDALMGGGGQGSHSPKVLHT